MWIYIIVKYQEYVEYINGFQISPRYDILFIEYQNVKYRYNENINIVSNTEIKIFLSSSITSLESFFDSSIDPNIQKIISIDLSNFDSSKIINMDKMFNGCSSLQSIDLSKFNTAKVTSMSYMFNGCSSLQSIDLSKFNTA